MSHSSFTLLEQRDKKRLGVIHTMHGDIFTPAFGPDATRGLIKNLSPEEIKNLSGLPFSEAQTNKDRQALDEIQILLSNTYHLRSYPGDEFIRDMGGLHAFMHWDRPILTDSGGFQVFSLIHGATGLKGKVTDEGAIFQDPRTGHKLSLTPESAIDIQYNLGSDIMIVLDDCRHYQDTKELQRSVYRTLEWAQRSKNRFIQLLKEKYDKTWEDGDRPLLFAVVQGGIDYDLRKLCTEKLMEIGFDGYGFGGWAINEKEYFPYDVMQFVADMLPIDKPRYAMGVGTPDDMLRCIEYGYDLFDCVIPSRNGRHGICYTTEGIIRITNATFKADTTQLDPQLQSRSSDYPKYYLHHLFKIKDALGGELLSIHNLKYFNYVMRKLFN